MSQNFKDSLHLPKTDFPMKANLAKREPEFLSFWKERDIYGKLMQEREHAPLFVLHDGPPYANGNIHIGTAFNKILKDLIPKYKWMRGFRAPYVPGWDTHGLPIELRVLKDEGLSKDDVSPAELRTRCTAYAMKYLDVQRNEFKRLGVLGDWDAPYVTFEPEYEAAQLGVFAEMVEKGLVYKGHKPVFWCVDCQTALAAAEIEYEDEVSPSIFVAYPLKDVATRFDVLGGKDVSVVIWTTTPWTLPASMAVALHPEYTYVFAPAEDGRVFLLAKELVPQFVTATKLSLQDPLLTCTGKELEGLFAEHPFYGERSVPLVLADYVLLDQGTGCVHTAPGHGVEDFETGIRYGLEIFNPVDDRGFFLEGTPLVGGLSLEKGAERVLGVLRGNGRLLGAGKVKHSYPHCWRCKNPVIFRSTKQWFVSVAAFKEATLEEIAHVRWVPAWGEERITNMVRDRSDWCISRQRIWGVPIPAFVCEECGQLVVSPDRVRRVQEKVRLMGSNIWWENSPEELVGDLAVCPSCESRKLRKETDIMDVWFDSGVSHRAVLETRPELQWPADLYLEGSDQHRGWFQTSLLTSVATRGKAPYKSVLTHGFIVDGEGRKMSKSLGNVIFPQEVIDAYGADVLRLWVASTDYRNDVRISQKIIDNLVESYRRIRNTARFLLGNLNGFDPKKHMVPMEKLVVMDRWILSRLQQVIRKATEGFENYEFHIPTYVIHQFCVNEVSSLFLDVSKDRLYADREDDLGRRSCQTALWELLRGLTRLVAPILSFTAEEIWQSMRRLDPDLEESVFLASWPEESASLQDEALQSEWDEILSVRAAVVRALERARSAGAIGHSLDAAVRISPSEAGKTIPHGNEEEFWNTLCIVSAFSCVKDLPEDAFLDEETGIRVSVVRAKGEKCPRCWKYAVPTDDRGLCSRCASVLDSGN